MKKKTNSGAKKRKTASRANAVPAAKEPKALVREASPSRLKSYIMILSIVVILLVAGAYAFKQFSKTSKPAGQKASADVAAKPTSATAAKLIAQKANKTSCPKTYSPVCGNDNKTYSNSCYAKLANVTVVKQGSCKTKPTRYKPVTGISLKKEELEKLPDCMDDDGKDKYVRSKVYIKEGDQVKEAGEDNCRYQQTVLEFYCDGGKVRNVDMYCGDGGSCVDGRCVTADCHDSDGHDIMSSGFVAKAKVMHLDGCEGGGIREYFCVDNEVDSSLMECPLNHDCAEGACRSVGQEPFLEPDQCSDSDGGQDQSTKGITTKGPDSETDNCVSSSVLKEYWCENNDIQSADNNCGIGYECNDGACVPVSPPPASQTCTDSDGGKSFTVKGAAVVAFSGGGSMTSNDYCDKNNNNKLVEYYCDSNQAKSVVTDCPSGQYCNDGACGNEPTCTDPDGNDVLQQTTTTKGTESQLDYCQWDDEHVIHEAVCSSNKITLMTQSCPSGNWCQSGACVTEPACTETDSGKDYANYGSTTKGSQSNSDYCMGSSLKEFYCDGTGLFKEELYTCPSGCSGGKCN